MPQVHHTLKMATVDGNSLVAGSKYIDGWQTVSLFATTDENVASTSVCMHAVLCMLPVLRTACSADLGG